MAAAGAGTTSSPARSSSTSPDPGSPVTLGERLVEHGFVLPPGHRLVSVAEQPELRRDLGVFNAAVWAEFMLHDEVAGAYWDRLFSDFAGFQCGLFDAEATSSPASTPRRSPGTAPMPGSRTAGTTSSGDPSTTSRPESTQTPSAPSRSSSGRTARARATRP